MAPILATQATSGKPKLLDQVRDAIRLRHYSIRTEQAYTDWIKRFILFHHKRHPGDMGETEVIQFLTHLARHDNVAASTQNQALSALLFLYKVMGCQPESDRHGCPAQMSDLAGRRTEGDWLGD
jgi:site-specific recombinase XerD